MNDLLLLSVVALHLALGAFDMFYHHELTERLAFRETARFELRLHAARNFIYAWLFASFAFSVPHGAWAVFAIGLVALEGFITIVDFVEEDRSRTLPVTERVTHTVLCITYGVIVMLLFPKLAAFAAEPTALVPVFYTWVSLPLAFCALTVLVFGFKDLYYGFKVFTDERLPARELVDGLSARSRVLVTGATGFVGSRLVEALVDNGNRVTVLTRNPEKAAGLCAPYRVVTSLDQIDNDELFDVVVNLAGESIAGGLWTKKRKREIVESRKRTTTAVVDLCARLDVAPAVLVTGSAVGWYGIRDDEVADESAEPKDCFSHELCAAWEAEAARARGYGVRVVPLRIGIVMDKAGGLLAQLLPVYDIGLGGPLGDGRQWMSWISRDDLIRVIAFVSTRVSIEGPVNAVAPVPITANDFSRELGMAVWRPALLRIPARPLEFIAGDMARELLTGGQRVLPAELKEHGFRFSHPGLADALRYSLGTRYRKLEKTDRASDTVLETRT